MSHPRDTIHDPEQLKEAGNEFFKKGSWDDALDCYSQAIRNTKDDCEKQKAIYFKNRAACFLKMERFEDAVDDCNKSLEYVPKDPKALFRRCQAYEALNKIDTAYADAKECLNLDPKNKALVPILDRLFKAVQAKFDEVSQVANKVKNMFDIVFTLEGDTEKREKAASNLIVLSREKAGSELLFKEGVVAKIVRLLKVEKNQQIRLSCVRVIGELAKKDMERAKTIVKEAGLPFFIDIGGSSKNEEVITAVTYAVQCIIDSLSRYDLVKRWKEKKKDAKRMSNEDRKQSRMDEEKREGIMKDNAKELYGIMHVMCHSTVSRTITGEARDAIINLVMTNGAWDRSGWAEKMLKTDAYYRLMEVASELTCYKHESSMEITSSTSTVVGVCMGHLYEQMWSDDMRAAICDKIDEYSREKFADQGLESKVRITAAITTLLKHAPELGNSQLTKEGFLQMLLAMAQSDEYIEQMVASEALIAATAKKKDASSIITQGMDILKTLYKSKNDHIKVRALVGMCKLGSSAGHDASMRPLAEGSNEKLAEACRRFLVNPAKDEDLRKWATEGLSFLTLDADVKEKLVEDEAAIKSLIDLGRTGGQDCAYGVITTLVNCTNSFDKQEISDEMIELAKFAKHHVPQEHELDDPDFVDKRIWTLCKYGATSALAALAKTESKNMKELIARVMNAFCQHQELRGLVVQQGGSKALIPLTQSGTDKGKRCAASALARIGITQDPAIAFPGGRSSDVIRPVSLLLDTECDALENFEALMALGNLASLNETTRKRMLQEPNCVCAIENYMFEEHELIRRAAVQCWTNLCLSPLQVRRCEGSNDKIKYCVLLCGDDLDINVVKAAAGGLAMLTSNSDKICKKVFDAKQWNECLLNLMANEDVEICLRGCVVTYNMVNADKETAEKVFETQVMEVLQALILKANLDAGTAAPNATLAKVKEICEKSLEVAHKYNIVRTQQEAAQVDEEEEVQIDPWQRAPAAGAADRALENVPEDR